MSKKNFIQTKVLKHLGQSALCLLASMAIFAACQNPNTVGDPSYGDTDSLAAARNFQRVPNATPISTQSDLANIGVGFPANGDFFLTTNLSLTNWTPVCDPTAGFRPFTGTFDGAGYSITIGDFNPTALGNNTYLGIFATTASSALIQNLTVYLVPGSITTPAQYIAGVVGSSQSTTFKDVAVGGVNLNVTANGAANPSIGGITGQALGDTFIGDATTGSISVTINSTGTSNSALGGIAGAADSTTQFSGISATADLTASYPADTAADNDNSFYVGGVAGDSEGAVYTDIKVGGSIKVNAGMPFNGDYTNFNLLAVGGIIGYANGGSITDSASSAAITAESDNTVSVAGGLVGRGATTSTASSALLITNGVGTGSVTSTGGQTATSAAGIAGYVTNTTITNSHTTAGTITASAPSGAGAYDVYQAYAGGLVGYSGNLSTITLSSSTGQNVVANNAAYPYSGGLVAYQYGYNDFTNPPSNGSVTTQSYSTNTVTATASTNGLPYAGGLAAYSSIIGSLIENSFATGTVTAATTGNSAWAGGLVGANAQGSVVSKSYATGNVYVTAGTADLPYGPQPGAEVGAAGGGIAGTNYFSGTSATAPTTTIVQYCVALNSLIDGSASTGITLLHRVAGSLGVIDPTYDAGLGTLINNDANVNMLVTPGWNPDIGPNQVDGADIYPTVGQPIYTALNWDFATIWVMNGIYPVLQNNP
jgi:hypothetical protein